MELDWITLYDYMSIFSRYEIKQKINKFYESFYPLKFKKTGKKTCSIKYIQRSGLLGIVASYIQECLFALQIYLEAQYFLSSGKIKEEIKLSKMFIEIQKKNLEISLEMEKVVYVISEVYKVHNQTTEDKAKEKLKQKMNEKSFLEIKIICSLVRLFQFFYSLEDMRPSLDMEGFDKIENNLRLFAYTICDKAKNHIKLFPEIGEILVEILIFFSSDKKQSFNFHSHLSENNQGKKKTFPERIKKLIAVIPNKQKTILVNLNDENFCEYLTKSGLTIPREPVENYFRCEEQINSIIAEEQNFIESILISEKYRGKPQWKEKVMEQLVNLSVEKRMTTNSKLLEAKNFRLCQDFPINLY